MIDLGTDLCKQHPMEKLSKLVAYTKYRYIWVHPPKDDCGHQLADSKSTNMGCNKIWNSTQYLTEQKRYEGTFPLTIVINLEWLIFMHSIFFVLKYLKNVQKVRLSGYQFADTIENLHTLNVILYTQRQLLIDFFHWQLRFFTQCLHYFALPI